MKLWKSSMIIIGISVLVLSSMSAVAETDGTGDLWHWYATETSWGWGEATGHPNIDITDVSYTINGLELTLSMTVSGTIQTAENIIYMIYSGDPNEDIFYTVLYQNDYGVWTGTGVGGQNAGLLEDPISADGKTLSATFTLVEDTTISPYANAIEYSQSDDMLTSEWWQDWYPNEYFSGDGGPVTNDDVTCWQCNENNESVSQTFPAGTTCGEGDAEEYPYNTEPNCGNGAPPTGTPGFEGFILIGALTIAMILLRKRD